MLTNKAVPSGDSVTPVTSAPIGAVKKRLKMVSFIGLPAYVTTYLVVAAAELTADAGLPSDKFTTVRAPPSPVVPGTAANSMALDWSVKVLSSVSIHKMPLPSVPSFL